MTLLVILLLSSMWFAVGWRVHAAKSIDYKKRYETALAAAERSYELPEETTGHEWVVEKYTKRCDDKTTGRTGIAAVALRLRHAGTDEVMNIDPSFLSVALDPSSPVFQNSLRDYEKKAQDAAKALNST